jgi:hypothetical protein
MVPTIWEAKREGESEGWQFEAGRGWWSMKPYLGKKKTKIKITKI